LEILYWVGAPILLYLVIGVIIVTNKRLGIIDYVMQRMDYSVREFKAEGATHEDLEELLHLQGKVRAGNEHFTSKYNRAIITVIFILAWVKFIGFAWDKWRESHE